MLTCIHLANLVHLPDPNMQHRCSTHSTVVHPSDIPIELKSTITNQQRHSICELTSEPQPTSPSSKHYKLFDQKYQQIFKIIKINKHILQRDPHESSKERTCVRQIPVERS